MAKRDNAPKRRQTKKQLTSNQQEWKHQVTNLKRRIKDLEELGALVNVAIPEMPKRVTKAAIEKIKQMRRAYLQKRAVQVESTGEVVPYKAPERGKVEERRREVKKEREKEEQEQQKEYDSYDDFGYDEDDDFNISWEDDERPYASQSEYDNLLSYIDEFGPATPYLKDLLEQAIREKGFDVVMENISNHYDSIKEYSRLSAKYVGTEKGNGFAGKFAELITGSPLSGEQRIIIEKANDYLQDFTPI